MFKDQKHLFEDRDHIDSYNRVLLVRFADYLEERHKKTKDVFDCNKEVTINNIEDIINDFLNHLTLIF